MIHETPTGPIKQLSFPGNHGHTYAHVQRTQHI